MSFRHIADIWDRAIPASRAEILVMIALASWANEEGVCWPSVQSVSERARITERQARRILRKLEDIGVLKVKVQRGRNKTNLYVLDLSGYPMRRPPKKPDILTPTDQEKPDIFELKPDIAMSAEYPDRISKIKNEYPKPSGRSAPGKVDPRFTQFVEALDCYWKFKNRPDLRFSLGKAGGNELKRFLSDNPAVTLDQFRTCLNHRARSDMVHTQAIARWIGRALEFFDGPLDSFWKPKQAGRNGNGTSKADRKFADISETTARVFDEIGRIPHDASGNLSNENGTRRTTDMGGDTKKLLTRGASAGSG